MYVSCLHPEKWCLGLLGCCRALLLVTTVLVAVLITPLDTVEYVNHNTGQRGLMRGHLEAGFQ